MILGVVVSCLALGTPAVDIDLSGAWAFQLDPEGRGVLEGWPCRRLPGRASLPGSTDEQGFGEPAAAPEQGRLTRTHAYVGPAWYQRDVVIPRSWEGRHVVLRLERVHWESQVWVDGRYAGRSDSLCVPHVYDLTGLATPGEHRVTLCIDNTLEINVGHSRGGQRWAHSVTDETQTNWNGVIGRIALESRSPVWVAAVQVYPDVSGSRAQVRVRLGNDTGRVVKAVLHLRAVCEEHRPGPVTMEVEFEGDHLTTTVELPLGEGTRLWDEFDPRLYSLTVTCTADGETDSLTTTFGMRDFAAAGQHFQLNGRTVHLRGDLDCCVFPRTGYPPMDVASWSAVFDVARQYGLNHLRFHSWCPPEAAFAAADLHGFMLQVESPFWDGYGRIGEDTDRACFLAREVDRIVDTYGNHPSFCLLSLGNELGDGSDPLLAYLVAHLRERDKRHLYTSTTHPADWERRDDYFVGAGGVRGLVTPDSSHDYRDSVNGRDRPLIAHEIGQYAVFPNFDDAAKYTGHLKARYLDLFRERFARNIGLEHKDDYAAASGALAAVLYKEEIEAQLRTPNLAGFQLLGLMDFPGQGVAPIGMLDAFRESKGIITPEVWSSFCAPTVVLARLPKRTWYSDECLVADIEVRHHGPRPIGQGTWRWEVAGANGVAVEGALPERSVPTGGLTSLGGIQVPLDGLPAPAAYRLCVKSPDGAVQNDWNFWVYQRTTPHADTGHVFRTWGEDVRQALRRGASVVLMPGRKCLRHAVDLRFHPVFWSNQLFGGQPDCMGLLVDTSHPLFQTFPTAPHADWQWFDLLQRAESIVLETVPTSLIPLVSVVPDFNMCQRLSPLWEARVGEGRLLVCTLNLTDPEASPARRQFLGAMLRYVSGESFQPAARLTTEELDELFAPIPEHALASTPERLGAALLHVRAAQEAPASVARPWEAGFDTVIKRDSGFSYHVEGSVWRDADGAAWHGEAVRVQVGLPAGFSGDLYAFFHDWNRQGRVTHVFFEGKDQGPLSHFEEGRWLRFPVEDIEAAHSDVTLYCQREAGPNVMVSEIALIPAP